MEWHYSLAMILRLSFLSIVAFAGFLAQGQQLADVAQEFNQIRMQETQLNPRIDGQRFVNEKDWMSANEKTATPWLTYGETAFSDWLAGAQWISRNADNLPFDLDLYDKLEKLVLRNHYYTQFEIRRIKAAMNDEKISLEKGIDLIRRIFKGEKINFSGVDHSTLPGKFREEAIDEFKHNGEYLLPDGSRYLRSEEIDLARRNPLLSVDESSLVKIGNDMYQGTIYYPRIKDLRSLVEKSFEKVNQNLPKANGLEEKVRIILEFRTELMTIHRSLDGNGRTIRLLCDLLFLRAGLPPPAYPLENDIFGRFSDIYEKTLRDMRAYVTSLRYQRLDPKAPEVLFHWSTTGSYNWMLNHRQSQEQPPMQTIASEAILARQFPALAGRLGTFGWINPIKATNGGHFENGKVEWYIKRNQPPVLIGYFLDPKARVRTVRTISGAPETSTMSFQDVDLIYHQRLNAKGQLIYHEWVIINPQVVSRWTADPTELRPYIEKERERVRRLKRKYPELDRHFLSAAQETRYIKRVSNQYIDRFLNTPPTDPLPLTNNSCMMLFQN